MHISVFQIMPCAGKQVLHKLLQKGSRSMNIVLQIVIVRSDERIAEIPRIISEYLIAHIESESLQILDHEHSSRARIALTEWVNLPDTRNELGDMLDCLRSIQISVGKYLFLTEIIIECLRTSICGGIHKRKPS